MWTNYKYPTLTALVTIAAACAPPGATISITPLGAEQTYQATSEGAKIPLYAVPKPECPYDEIAVRLA